MEIFNIGPLEFIIILVLMFIILGPKEMILTAHRIGVWVRKMTHSPMWREIIGYSAEIRELPKKVMDETGLQETLAEIQQTTKETAAELNAQIQDANNQIKEAAQATHVPGIEEIIQENQAAGAQPVPAQPLFSNPPMVVPHPEEVVTIASPEPPVSTEVTTPLETPAAAEAPTLLEATSSAAETVESAPPAVLVTAPEAVEAAPVAKKPRKKKVTAESAPVESAPIQAAPVDAAAVEPPQAASPEPEAAPRRARARKTTPKPVEPPAEEADASPFAAAPAVGEVDQPSVEPVALPSTEILQVTQPPDGAAPLNGNGQEPPARKPRKPRAPKVKVMPPDGTAPAEGAPTGGGTAEIYPTAPTQDDNAA